MSRTYEAIRPYIITKNADDGSVLDFLTLYERGNVKRDRRGDAISDGWSTWGHDDFNIAVWEGEAAWSQAVVGAVDGSSSTASPPLRLDEEQAGAGGQARCC